MPGTEFFTAASITVMPGSASTTRSVPSLWIKVILAMTLAGFDNPISGTGRRLARARK
jgi:hypothetical protein